MCKRGLKSHYILTLPSKKNNASKADVKFTKLKMKVKKAQTNWVKGYFDNLIIVTLPLVLSYKYTYFQGYNSTQVIFIVQLQIVQQNVYFKVIALLFHWAPSERSLWSLVENRKSKANSLLLTAKW